MDYEPSDSSGTDDDLPPHQSRFSRGGRASGNGRSAVVGSAPFPRMHNDLETQIHHMEQDAYGAILRAFKAQSDAITWEKEGLITELRKELRVSDDEHRELLAKANADDVIKRIREWRKANGPGMLNNSLPLHEAIPSPTVSASRKKQKTSQSAASLPFGAPSSSALKRGPPSVVKGKKSKACPSTGGVIGRAPVAEGTPFNPLIGRKVWTRWPEDNHFYEAVITDYEPIEGRHALVYYDKNTADETWEWINLKEISPEDIRWEGEDPEMPHSGGRPVTGRGVKKCMTRGGGVSGSGRGRGTAKGHSNKEFSLPQNGIGKNAPGDIEILHTDTLIKEVEKIYGVSHPDPAEIDKARKVLREHEEALVDAIARLEDVSDGESDRVRFSQGRSMDQDQRSRKRQYDEMGGEQGRVIENGDTTTRHGRAASDSQQDDDVDII